MASKTTSVPAGFNQKFLAILLAHLNILKKQMKGESVRSQVNPAEVVDKTIVVLNEAFEKIVAADKATPKELTHTITQLQDILHVAKAGETPDLKSKTVVDLVSVALIYLGNYGITQTTVKELTGRISQLVTSEADLKRMLAEREETLKETREELNTALGGSPTPPASTERVGLLAADQSGVIGGFYLINREWHDNVVRNGRMLLNLPEHRKRYEGLLAGEVLQLATANYPEQKFGHVSTLVGWDMFLEWDMREEGYAHGPIFSAGNVKFAKAVEAPQEEPEAPKEPALLANEQPQIHNGLFMLNNEWRHWYLKNHNYLDISSINDRCTFRDAVSKAIKVATGIEETQPDPIVIIDWDTACATGNIFFVAPSYVPTKHVVSTRTESANTNQHLPSLAETFGMGDIGRGNIS